jgi:hypothetical protein
LIGPLDEELRWVAEALQRRMGFRLRTGPGPAHEHGKTYGAGATGEPEAGLVGVRDVGLVLVHSADQLQALRAEVYELKTERRSRKNDMQLLHKRESGTEVQMELRSMELADCYLHACQRAQAAATWVMSANMLRTASICEIHRFVPGSVRLKQIHRIPAPGVLGEARFRWSPSWSRPHHAAFAPWMRGLVAILR